MCSSLHQVLKPFLEKGTGPWPPSREPLLKKLKISSKSSVQRSASVSSKGTSTVDSPSSIESSSDSDPEGDDSEYETSSELEVEPEEPSPLPSNRPLDPLKAIEYDIIKAVWAKSKVSLSGVVIRTALSEYWNIMKGVRDRWKAEVVTLQQASEKKEKAKIIEYERRAANQRKLLETCIRLTLKHGHPDIIEKYVSFHSCLPSFAALHRMHFFFEQFHFGALFRVWTLVERHLPSNACEWDERQSQFMGYKRYSLISPTALALSKRSTVRLLLVQASL